MWIFGLGLMLVGVFLLVVGGIFFLTIILIPFAIIAALIGIGLLIVGGLAALIRGTIHIEHHTTPAPRLPAFSNCQVLYKVRCPEPKRGRLLRKLRQTIRRINSLKNIQSFRAKLHSAISSCSCHPTASSFKNPSP